MVWKRVKQRLRCRVGEGETEETGFSPWNVICCVLCGYDIAKRHRTDHRPLPFLLLLPFLQFNYHSSQTHMAVDCHSVWDLSVLVCLCAAGLVSSTNDLAGSSEMLNKMEVSLSKLKEILSLCLPSHSHYYGMIFFKINLHLSAFHLSVTVPLPSFVSFPISLCPDLYALSSFL